MSYKCRRVRKPDRSRVPGFENVPPGFQESSCPRFLGCFAAVAALASLPGRADRHDVGDGDPVNVQPAPAPQPALRYQLLPELKEMHPGNPIQHYMKTMMVQKKFFFDEEAFRHRETLLTMPLKELPAQELKEYGRFALSQVELGGPAR